MNYKEEGSKDAVEISEHTEEKEKLEKKKKENEIEGGKEKDLDEEEKYKAELRELSKEELVNKIISAEEDLSKLKEENKELKDNNDEWEDKYMHLQAEFENSQKRWDKARKALMNQYTANVLRNFLPLYDSFKSAIKDLDDKNPLTAFYKQFLNILKSYGAQPLETKEGDIFDYDKHEALSSIEREDLPNNSIVDVIQEGWKFKDDVLRYAKVIISRKPKPPPKPPEKKDKKEEKETEEKGEKHEKEEKEQKKTDSEDTGKIEGREKKSDSNQ
jgi:molecular chaperone GrpE